MASILPKPLPRSSRCNSNSPWQPLISSSQPHFLSLLTTPFSSLSDTTLPFSPHQHTTANPNDQQSIFNPRRTTTPPRPTSQTAPHPTLGPIHQSIQQLPAQRLPRVPDALLRGGPEQELQQVREVQHDAGDCARCAVDCAGLVGTELEPKGGGGVGFGYEF
ncbi:hypothetical protein AKJ16_DCAP01205 [Drosera capensis]